jgi:thiol-disulfide isomerase/thioredoxin
VRIEKGRVRAPEIGRVWLNSPPLSFRQLRGRVVLVDFWDYTCVNCIRTLPYVQTWHETYRDRGLTVIGVHTPEFTFAQYESNVERGIREFHLTYPIVVDNEREIWNAFANRSWPTKYLLDKDGYLRFEHSGEREYVECERVIQELLREIDPAAHLPEIMTPLREEDHPGAVCYRPSAELYVGNARGCIGNEGGFKEGQTSEYEFSGTMKPNCFYATGRWTSTSEYLEAVGDGPHSLKLKYEASALNLVMAALGERLGEVLLLQDGKPLARGQAGRDTRFRDTGESYVVVDSARMYSLVDDHDFGEHDLELLCSPGIAAFAFTFTACVNPSTKLASVIGSDL